MMKLTPRQRQVIEYLKGKDYTSPTIIGREVWGKGRHSAAASPVCKRLVASGYLERDVHGQYRLRGAE